MATSEGGVRVGLRAQFRDRLRQLTILGAERLSLGYTCDQESYSTEQTSGGGGATIAKLNITQDSNDLLASSSMSVEQEVDE